MIVTATEIKLKGILGFVRFILRLRNIIKQLDTADGLVFVKFRGLKTLTGWKNRESMVAFRGTGRHLQAMKNIKHIGHAKSITWETQSEPDWNDAIEKLKNI